MVCKQLNFCTSSTTVEFVFFCICLNAMNITNGMMNAEWYGVLVKDFVFLCFPFCYSICTCLSASCWICSRCLNVLQLATFNRCFCKMLQVFRLEDQVCLYTLYGHEGSVGALCLDRVSCVIIVGQGELLNYCWTGCIA